MSMGSRWYSLDAGSFVTSGVRGRRGGYTIDSPLGVRRDDGPDNAPPCLSSARPDEDGPAPDPRGDRHQGQGEGVCPLLLRPSAQWVGLLTDLGCLLRGPWGRGLVDRGSDRSSAWPLHPRLRAPSNPRAAPPDGR